MTSTKLEFPFAHPLSRLQPWSRLSEALLKPLPADWRYNIHGRRAAEAAGGWGVKSAAAADCSRVAAGVRQPSAGEAAVTNNLLAAGVRAFELFMQSSAPHVCCCLVLNDIQCCCCPACACVCSWGGADFEGDAAGRMRRTTSALGMHQIRCPCTMHKRMHLLFGLPFAASVLLTVSPQQFSCSDLMWAA